MDSATTSETFATVPSDRVFPGSVVLRRIAGLRVTQG